MNLKLFYINENGQSLNIKQFKAMYLHKVQCVPQKGCGEFVAAVCDTI